MVPSLAKIVKDVEQALNNPGKTAHGLAIDTIGSAAQNAARNAAVTAETKAKIGKIKQGSQFAVPHTNEDIVTIAAVAVHLRGLLLNMPVIKSGHQLYLQQHEGKNYDAEFDPRSFPLSFFLASEANAVRAANNSIDSDIALLKDLRPVFKTSLPMAGYSVLGIGYVDIKSVASKFSSLDAGNYYYLELLTRQCEYCIKNIDNALIWAGKKNEILDELEAAHVHHGHL